MTRRFSTAALGAALLFVSLGLLVPSPAGASVPRVLLIDEISATW